MKSEGPTLGYWNEDGIRRILENLVSNAIKYGDQDLPVIITIKGTDHLISLKVHNEGAPISKQDQQTIFQPFTRAKSAEKNVGWGIGLAGVKT